MAVHLVPMVATVRICAVIEKPFQSGRIQRLARGKDDGEMFVPPGVHIRAVRDQFSHHGRMLFIHGPHQRGRAGFVLNIWISARFQQRLNDRRDMRVDIRSRVDHRDLAFADLSRIVGVVSQETYLFHESVRENLRFAKPDATDEEIEAAARAVGAQRTVDAMAAVADKVTADISFILPLVPSEATARALVEIDAGRPVGNVSLARPIQ